jgi:hypothetical protein
MPSYEEQLARAQRYYERFKKLNDGMTLHAPSEEYIDDVYAFFQCCYHVKDHLKNDPAFTKHDDKAIEAYVNNTAPLAICADICNALKHLMMRKPPRSGDEPKFGGREFSVNVEQGRSAKPSTTAIRLSVEHKGTTLDAFKVATDAMSDWSKFI